MLGESDRLARIVDEFLEFSRMRRPEMHDLDLGPLAEEVRHLLGMRQDLPPGLEIMVGIDPACPLVHGDPGQMRQVLLNLLNNAIDAVRGLPNPRVGCHIRQATDPSRNDGQAVEIRIEDNGPGIPDEVKPHLFTPFYSTKAKGTGLGLALVSRIIREHEGILDLQSQPGLGTAVIIHLPVRSVTRQFRRVAGGSGIMGAGPSHGGGRSSPTDGG
jgi:signal transduction histidine kinase